MDRIDGLAVLRQLYDGIELAILCDWFGFKRPVQLHAVKLINNCYDDDSAPNDFPNGWRLTTSVNCYAAGRDNPDDKPISICCRGFYL